MSAAGSASARVLVVDDEQQDRQSLAQIVCDLGYRCETAADGEEALQKQEAAPCDVIISDLMMPKMDGFRAPSDPLWARRSDSDHRSHWRREHRSGDLHRARFAGVLVSRKACPRHRSSDAAERAIQHKSLVKETERLHRQLSQQGYLADLVGTSQPMREVFSAIQQIAPSSASVLITGESGTGKELVASAIHKLSPRASRPFVAVNCAALPESLIESELFGHEKGAFTGAVGRRAGCFEQAHQGTLFLDEIGDMPLAMQPRLLRALQEGDHPQVGRDQ